MISGIPGHEPRFVPGVQQANGRWRKSYWSCECRPWLRMPYEVFIKHNHRAGSKYLLAKWTDNEREHRARLQGVGQRIGVLEGPDLKGKGMFRRFFGRLTGRTPRRAVEAIDTNYRLHMPNKMRGVE